ncbi:hypothetical protein [Cryptosporangium minutisporangium]|uniref:Transposase n=1 Tax=Cryptosporangium minutisporangium TaxID=113569 RepID=A0ABP6SW11_9ACTN
MGYHIITTDQLPLVQTLTERDADGYFGGYGAPAEGEELDNSTLLTVIESLSTEDALVLELPALAVRQLAVRLNECANQIETREAALRKRQGNEPPSASLVARPKTTGRDQAHSELGAARVHRRPSLQLPLDRRWVRGIISVPRWPAGASKCRRRRTRNAAARSALSGNRRAPSSDPPHDDGDSAATSQRNSRSTAASRLGRPSLPAREEFTVPRDPPRSATGLTAGQLVELVLAHLRDPARDRITV